MKILDIKTNMNLELPTINELETPQLEETRAKKKFEKAFEVTEDASSLEKIEGRSEAESKRIPNNVEMIVARQERLSSASTDLAETLNRAYQSSGSSELVKARIDSVDLGDLFVDIYGSASAVKDRLVELRNIEKGNKEKDIEPRELTKDESTEKEILSSDKIGLSAIMWLGRQAERVNNRLERERSLIERNAISGRDQRNNSPEQ